MKAEKKLNKKKLFWLPNALSFLRLFGSLWLIVFDTTRINSLVVYLLCGTSDVLDGMLARKLSAESRFGSVLDTAADICFCALLAKILLPEVESIWLVWAAAVAAVKLVAGFISLSRKGEFIPHSAANRALGISLFSVGALCLCGVLAEPFIFIVCVAAGIVSAFELGVALRIKNEKRNL